MADTRWRYVVGLGGAVQPGYSGGSQYELRLKPIWAVQWGRWRIGSGGVGSLLGRAAEDSSGASTDLYRGDRLASSLALRWDSGRPSSDDPALAGLRDVRSTLRARVAVHYRLSDPWSLDLMLSEDVLGRGAGLLANVGFSRSGRWTADTTWALGAGLTMADARFVRGRHGVPVAAAQPARPAFQPGGGPHELHWGLSTRSNMGSRWVLLGTVGAARLVGDAADSPLTDSSTRLQLGLGLVWRGL